MTTKTKFEEPKVHISISKWLVIRVLTDHPEDLPKCLPTWKGTAAEAIAALEALPYEFLANDCDNRNPNGSCAGHERR